MGVNSKFKPLTATMTSMRWYCGVASVRHHRPRERAAFSSSRACKGRALRVVERDVLCERGRAQWAIVQASETVPSERAVLTRFFPARFA
jgi:hypothetical protein